MPRKAKRVDSQAESRSAAVGRKRNRPAQKTDDTQDLPRKRRKNSRVRNKQKSKVAPEEPGDFIPFSSLQDSNFAQGQSMSAPDYGQNRLKSGFQRQMKDDSEEEGEVSSGSPSQPIVYEIDSTDDEGGITLNINENGRDAIVISDDETGTETRKEAGIQQHTSKLAAVHKPEPMMTVPSTVEMTDEIDKNPSSGGGFVVDTSPTKQQICLKDLTSEQLQEQINYVFWHLQRDQIDLNRPARCLHCQEEGHINQQCPQKTCKACGEVDKHTSSICPKTQRCSICREMGHAHCNGMKNTTVPCDICSATGHAEQECEMRHSLPTNNTKTVKLELWISCCYCASKSHLIGDCPTARNPTSSTPRWSLRNLDSDQVMNLSIQKGVDKLEMSAQNRGMRPEGMQIRGRANDRHNADSGRRDSDNSDDLAGFLHHSPRRDDRRQPPRPVGKPYPVFQQAPYDRQSRRPDGPDSYRPPRSAYYATDSFGRNRSRSPPPPSRQGRRQSPSSDGSSYRPAHSSRQPSPYRGFDQRDNTSRPAPGISFDMPVRKGSNPNPNNSQNYKPRKRPKRGGGPSR